MSITKKTKEIKEESFELNYRGVVEIFNNKELAERKIKEIDETYQNRYKDFVIAKYLFDYKWMNFCGSNYLVNDLSGRSYMRDDEKGFKKGGKVEGIFSCSLFGENIAPNYADYNDFIVLLAKLSEFLRIQFVRVDNIDFICSSLSDTVDNYKIYNKDLILETLKKSEHWRKEYLMVLGLKEIAYSYCVHVLGAPYYKDDIDFAVLS